MPLRVSRSLPRAGWRVLPEAACAPGQLERGGPAPPMNVVAPNEPEVSVPGRPVRRVRDPRLDFFRGLAMFIIFIAHMPENYLALWIPARFGFSDATEIFVFCSGMASSIAFGSVFAAQGWAMGTARVLHRIWQVYWAHVGVFLVVASLMAAIDAAHVLPTNYVALLNLAPFFDETAPTLIGLVTLTYVPNYFDVLPMYLVILVLMPVVMALAQMSRYLAAAFVIALWLGANLHVLELAAEPWSMRPWFFNPFGWQLVFFTGFAFLSGWLPAPPVTRPLLVAAGVILIASVPLAYFRILQVVPVLDGVAGSILFLTDKTSFGALRYAHFLAFAYLAWAAAGTNGARLMPQVRTRADRMRTRAIGVISKVGQQPLAVYMTSMVLARAIGAVLDAIGVTVPTMTLGTLFGFAVLTATAYTTAWFKSQPWRKTR